MAPDKSKPVFMYLATDNVGAVMKIGISNNPFRRDLRDGGLFPKYPDRTNIVLLRITRGSREIEIRTLDRFKQYRISNQREWFHANDEIAQYFASLPDYRKSALAALQAHSNRVNQRI